VDDVRFHPADAEMTTMTYDPVTLQLTSKSDASNNPTYYAYDNLQRLTGIKDYQGNSLNQYSYYYSRQGNNDMFNASDPNYVESLSYRDGTNYTDAKDFSDGLGRSIQKQVKDGSSTIFSSNTTYDLNGRLDKSYKPYEIH